MNGGTVAYLLYGGYSENGNADGNTVTINGGTADYIFGGWTNSSSGSASNNVVNITGGTITYFVHGGDGTAGGIPDNNTINLSGNPTLASTYLLGYNPGGGSGTGNTQHATR
jgi:hypothetical protein